MLEIISWLPPEVTSCVASSIIQSSDFKDGLQNTTHTRWSHTSNLIVDSDKIFALKGIIRTSGKLNEIGHDALCLAHPAYQII